MSEQQQAKQKAKGTAKTEAIIGAASNKMVTATKALNDAVANALKLTSTIDENALKIADQEEKLTNLKQEFDNKKAQNKIDLDLAYKADQKVFADLYLATNGLLAVEKDEFIALEQEVKDLKQNFADKVKAEVGREKGIAESRLENEKKLFEAQYQAKEAQNLAKIQNLEAQLTFANQQTTHWQTQLNEERKASVERAKAGAIGSVNVGAPNGR